MWHMVIIYAYNIFLLFSVYCLGSDLGEDQLSSAQLLSCVWLFVTPWIAALQASLSITNSRSSLKLMSIESVMPSSQLLELQFQHQSFQWTPRTDLLPSCGSLKSLLCLWSVITLHFYYFAQAKQWHTWIKLWIGQIRLLWAKQWPHEFVSTHT